MNTDTFKGNITKAHAAGRAALHPTQQPPHAGETL